MARRIGLLLDASARAKQQNQSDGDQARRIDDSGQGASHARWLSKPRASRESTEDRPSALRVLADLVEVRRSGRLVVTIAARLACQRDRACHPGSAFTRHAGCKPCRMPNGDAHRPKNSWECQRCLWILGGKGGEEIPEHSPACPFRDSGSDPDPKELQIGVAES